MVTGRLSGRISYDAVTPEVSIIASHGLDTYPGSFVRSPESVTDVEVKVTEVVVTELSRR
jgi:hypothetical protein